MNKWIEVLHISSQIKSSCLYRSPSQTRDIHETFANNFELTLDTVINKNPFSIIALGDFNAKATNWYKNNISSYEDLKIHYHYIPIWLTIIN